MVPFPVTVKKNLPTTFRKFWDLFFWNGLSQTIQVRYTDWSRPAVANLFGKLPPNARSFARSLCWVFCYILLRTTSWGFKVYCKEYIDDGTLCVFVLRTGVMFLMVMYQILSNVTVLEALIQERAIFMWVFIFVTILERLKMREWKMWERQKCKGGKCKSGNNGSKMQRWKMRDKRPWTARSGTRSIVKLKQR